ncbi:MAG: MerR family DNA-binding transcriptional regulator [Pseudomonadota bacterium]
MPRADKSSPTPSQTEASTKGALAMPPAWTLDDIPGEDDAHDLMGISEVCAAFDMSPRTLRFYETKELLAPQRINGARVYGKPVRDQALPGHVRPTGRRPHPAIDLCD